MRKLTFILFTFFFTSSAFANNFKLEKAQNQFLLMSPEPFKYGSIFRVYQSIDGLIKADRCDLDYDAFHCEAVSGWVNLCSDQINVFQDSDDFKSLIFNNLLGEPAPLTTNAFKTILNNLAELETQSKVFLIMASVVLVIILVQSSAAVVMTTALAAIATVSGIKRTQSSPSTQEILNKRKRMVRILNSYAQETTIFESRFYDNSSEKYLLEANAIIASVRTTDNKCLDLK